MSLQNLNQLAIDAQTAFNTYHKQEIVLSSDFKREFSELLRSRSSETIHYSQYTSVIETSSGLTITFPNQWFFIASYFVEYLIALKEYKREYSMIFQGLTDSKDLIKKIKESKLIPNDIENKIENHFSNSLDKEYFKKFLSEYSWWFGNKTIDRGDYYVSPILNLAKVVNVSQAYIAELANILSDNHALLDSLKKSQVRENNIDEEILDETVVEENSSIRDFALNVFNYFYKDKWATFFDNTKTKFSKLNSKSFISHDFDSFVRLVAEYPDAQTKETLSSAGTLRFFENPIYQTDDRYFYFTTQWFGTGDESLSFQNLQRYFESNYPEYKFEKTGTTYKLIKKASPLSLVFNYKAFHQKTEEAGLTFSEKIVSRFVASLCTKPFVICSGLSGSGKTKLAQCFVQWICESDEQYKIVPVGADWTNREPLLGFPNGLDDKTYVFPDSGALQLIIKALDPVNVNKPYFLILDEMNLSHVERYFADFLSIMESHDKIKLYSGNTRGQLQQEILWPKNLFIIGTVNIDETTYMFSPKVLDRANVIEFRVTDEEMNHYLSSTNSVDLVNLLSAGSNMAYSFLSIAKNKSLETVNDVELQAVLMDFFIELKKAGAEFGYRSAAEIIRFAGVINIIDANWTITEIIDAAVMQKLLPKVHGSRRKLEPILKTLGTLCLTAAQKFDDLVLLKNEIDFADTGKIKYPISLEKILRMYNGLISNGFTSYAEA